MEPMDDVIVYSQTGHAVEVFLTFHARGFAEERVLNAIFEIDELLREIIEGTDVGLYDGHEHGDNSVTYFIFGPDANQIHETIEPVLSYLPPLPG